MNFLSLQIWVSEKQWGQKQEVLHCNKYFIAWTRWSYCDSLCFCLMRRRLVYCHLAFVCSERQSKFLILTSTGVFFVSNLSSKIIMTKCDVTDVKSLSYQFTYEVLQAGLVEEKGGGGGREREVGMTGLGPLKISLSLQLSSNKLFQCFLWFFCQVPSNSKKDPCSLKLIPKLKYSLIPWNKWSRFPGFPKPVRGPPQGTKSYNGTFLSTTRSEPWNLTNNFWLALFPFNGFIVISKLSIH